jgi:hypothetical protein
MSSKTATQNRQNKSYRKAVQLGIRARTNVPDPWLAQPGKRLSRRLVTTGSQCRATVHDVLGRQSTKGMTKGWAKLESWKELDNVRTKKPRTRLRDLHDLLEPLIASERLEVEVKSKAGSWITLAKAAADPILVI